MQTADPLPAPRISGRIFVPIFVSALVVVLVVTLVLFRHMRPVIRAAHEKTYPLQSKLNAACRPPAAESYSLRDRGACSSTGSLELDVTDPGPAAKSATYAILSESPGEPPTIGRFDIGSTAHISLEGMKAGSHMLVFVVSSAPADPDELRHAIAMSPAGDVPDRLVRIEQFATVLRLRDVDVITERISFRVDAP